MMRRLLKVLLLMTLAVCPLWAQVPEDGQVLVLPLSTDLATEQMARVLTSTGRPSQCLAPVAVTRIDGEMRTVSAQGFLIEPGIHTLNGKATIDLANCPLSDANLYINNTGDLEIDFEAGSTYYIAYHHAPANPGEWALLVWHVEKGP